MRGVMATSTARVDFLIGTNLSEQAEAIARQCVRYLAEENCMRLGVIFPARVHCRASLRARSRDSTFRTTTELRHIVPGIFESPEWQAWLGLQRAPRLDSFLRFLNALPDPAVLSPNISRQVSRTFYAKATAMFCWTISKFCALIVRRAKKNSKLSAKLYMLCVSSVAGHAREFLEQSLRAFALRLEAICIEIEIRTAIGHGDLT